VAEIDLGALKVTLAVVPRNVQGKPTPFKTSSFDRLEDARAASPFALLQPSYVPPGYSLLDTALLSAPQQMAALTFQNKASGASFVLFESPVSQYEKSAGETPTIFAAGDSISESAVGDVKAAMVEIAGAGKAGPGTTLIWERQGLLLQVSSRAVALDELQRLAASLA
jgi:hypothetical protein